MTTQLAYVSGLPMNPKQGNVYLLRLSCNTYKSFRHLKAVYTNKGFVAKEGNYIVNPKKIIGYYQ